MSIERMSYYDLIRMAYVQDIATAKANIAEIIDDEFVFAIAETTLLLKKNGKLYSVPLTEVI